MSDGNQPKKSVTLTFNDVSNHTLKEIMSKYAQLSDFHSDSSAFVFNPEDISEETHKETPSRRVLGDGSVNYPEIARNHVYLHISLEKDYHVALDDVYVVWFSYILGGWKALVSTNLRDGRYYELTHSTEKNETYLDTYIKSENTVLEGVK